MLVCPANKWIGGTVCQQHYRPQWHHVVSKPGPDQVEINVTCQCLQGHVILVHRIKILGQVDFVKWTQLMYSVSAETLYEAVIKPLYLLSPTGRTRAFNISWQSS